jgi:protein TonB
MKKYFLLSLIAVSAVNINLAAQEKPKTVIDSTKTNAVYETVDQYPIFSSGGKSFRGIFQENFNVNAIKGEGTIKTEVSFVVETDGTITDIKAMGDNSKFNEEVVKAVGAVKTKWTPAKVNGQPVRTRFRMPVTMNFR